MQVRQDSLGFLIADLSRLMRRAFAQQLTGSSLTLAQARALLYLSRNEGMRQVDLAANLEIQPMTLARLVDQLEAGGLLERRSDPADRRAYRLYLKPAAAPHLEAVKQVAKAIRSDVLRGVGKEHADILLATLEQMHGNLVEQEEG
ncbi:MarR family winged helix-turn-helix transcriptional regulator [Noviherbaspirillum massiliense]|uniref:MarR family winged helix-turn-helix transcriptional regulator n=1 Tax=Noviherbaspirillum massiliense TaxID=1465823 RepID=UPI0002F334C0|nr:MarR family transcriptional regulator [Noviherbaspirillum massiliense]